MRAPCGLHWYERHGLIRRQQTVVCKLGEVEAEHAVCEREARVECNGPFVPFLAARHRVGRQLLRLMQRPEVRLVAREARRVPPASDRFSGQFHLESFGNRRGDFVLHGEDVCQFPVIALRPQVIPIGGVDKLRRHANTGAGPTNTAFDTGAHVQRLGNLPDVLLLADTCLALEYRKFVIIR